MQERYLGDVHDFLKYKFLLHLKRTTDFRLGLNWYLTDPKEVDKIKTNDGEKRFHLTGPNANQWSKWDEQLSKKLKTFKSKANRKLKNYYDLDILGNHIIYYDPKVPTLHSSRNVWHEEAVQKFKGHNCDFVFLDPDNGLEVPSATGRQVAKYADYSHIADYYANDIAVISIQFARQCNPFNKAKEVREKMHSLIDLHNCLPIIRCRVSPNTLFIPVSPPDKYEKLKSAIMSFAKSSPKVINDRYRVEIIK